MASKSVWRQNKTLTHHIDSCREVWELQPFVSSAAASVSHGGLPRDEGRLLRL